MELEIQYDEPLDCLMIRASGDIKFKDLPTINQRVSEHEKFRFNISQICDCSNGALLLSMEELKTFARESSEFSRRFGDERKLALVDAKPINFGLMRQYEVFLDAEPGVDIRVFKSLSDARSWIAS